LITKYKIDPLIATLMYSILVLLILSSNSVLSAILIVTCLEVSFEVSRLPISCVSSNILSASDSSNPFKIDFSQSSKFFL